MKTLEGLDFLGLGFFEEFEGPEGPWFLLKGFVTCLGYGLMRVFVFKEEISERS